MKKLMRLITAFFFTSVSGCASENNNALGDATVTVRVVDDVGRPIKDVRSRLLSLSWYDAPAGLTDTNGVFKIYDCMCSYDRTIT